MLARCAATAAVLLVALPAAAQAPAWPSKPLRIVVPFAAGGGVDIVTRTVAPRLAERLGQQVVVDNRPGASGNIASEIVAKSAPDGYTLLMASNSNTVNMTLFPKVAYSVERDLAAVSTVGTVATALCTHPSLPARTLKDLIALARARPGEMTFGSGGSGTTQHLSGELLRRITGMNIVHVPYKGGAPAVTDTIGGQITMVFTNVLESVAFVKGGRLRAIAVTTAERSPSMPDVPTIAESGVPGFDVPTWWGVMTTAGTPPAVIARLNQEMLRALDAPEVKDRLGGLGARVRGSTPEAFTAFVSAEVARWAKVIREANIRAE